MNSLYDTFTKYDKALEEHKALILPTTTKAEGEGEEQPRKIDDYERGLRQELEADLLRSVGEDRLRRFKAAGIVPED